MINERDDGRICIAGPMLIADATALFEGGLAFLRSGSGERIFDFSSVAETDSSALAVLFGWIRAARKQGATVHFNALPTSVLSFASLYGVADFLPTL